MNTTLTIPTWLAAGLMLTVLVGWVLLLHWNGVAVDEILQREHELDTRERALDARTQLIIQAEHRTGGHDDV